MVQVSLPFPEKGLVYDYRLDDGGISSTRKSDDDDEEDKKKKKVHLMMAFESNCTKGFVYVHYKYTGVVQKGIKEPTRAYSSCYIASIVVNGHHGWNALSLLADHFSE